MPHKMMNSQIADVLHDNRLSIEARMLYAYLCSFDDGTPPSTCQIIRQLGIGKTRFYRYRNELEAFGLIEVEHDHVRRRGRKVLFPRQTGTDRRSRGDFDQPPDQQ